MAAPELISQPERQKQGKNFGTAELNRTDWQEQFRGSDVGAECADAQIAPRDGRGTARKTRNPLIFVPIDFSESSIEAARFGLSIAQKTHGRIMLFHVVHLNLSQYGPANPARLKAALCREAMANAEPLLRLAQEAGVQALCAVEEGIQAAAILKGAKQWEADVIVMASQPRRWLSRLFRRPTVEQVVREADCPVMILQKNCRKN